MNFKKHNYIDYANFILIIGIALSLIIPFAFYKSFNRIVIGEPDKANSDSSEVMFNVDECQYVNGMLITRGWATPKDGSGNVLAFAIIDGQHIKLRTSQVKRIDVSSAMSKPGLYDNSGFSASINYGKHANSVAVLLQIMKGSKIYVVKHECK